MNKEYLDILALLTKDIHTLKKEMKNHPEINTGNISAKDVLFYVLPIIAAHDSRIGVVETKLKQARYMVATIVSVSALILGLAIFL